MPNVDKLGVVLKQDLYARADLRFTHNTVLFKEGHVLFALERLERLNRGLEVQKSAACGLALPLSGIGVAVKDNAAMRGERFLDQLLERRVKVIGPFIR